MDGDRIEMSQRERDRLKVMAAVVAGKRTQAEAGRLLKRSVRQVRRIQRRLQAEGDGGIVHRLRGRRPNNRKLPQFRQAVLQTYRQDYQDFGPTLAAEKLADRCVYSWKPNPAMICAPGVDWEAVDKVTRETLEIARGCCVEIIMKDTHTFCGDPSRIERWSQIASRAAAEAG